LLEALAGMSGMVDLPPPGKTAAFFAATPHSGEQQLVSVLVAFNPVEMTIDLQGQPVMPSPQGSTQRLIHGLMRLGAQVEWLPTGALVGVLGPLSSGSATDQVMQAARAARMIREHWPDAQVTLTTGRGTVGTGLPTGDVIDRAWRLLGQQENTPKNWPAGTG